MVNPMIKPQNKKPENKTFYHKDKDLEIKIKFKKDYSNLTPEDRIFYFIEDVLLSLELEEDQLNQVARSYD